MVLVTVSELLLMHWIHWPSGYIAQWLERLTADQQVPGSNPGVPFSLQVLQKVSVTPLTGK